MTNIYKKVQKLFPNEKVNKEHDGWTSWAFSTKDKIIRVPKGRIKDYEKESKILDFLQDKLTVAIPKTKVFKDDFFRVVHNKIMGKQWNLQSYNKLDEKSKNLFCEDIAKFFVELHSSFSKKDEKYFDFLKEKRANYEFNIIVEKLAGILLDSELKKLEKISRELELLNSEKVLVHKDFCGDNSVVDEQHRLKGVFDFLNFGLYNRHYEFLSLYYSDHMDMLKNIIKIYESITSKKIDFNIIRKMKLIGDASALTYLEFNPEIKKDKIESFNRILDFIKSELKLL
jgi:aminoglycoside phosphotransferase